MKKALEYLNETLGLQVVANPITKSSLGRLPLYISQTYHLYNVSLFNKEVVFAELMTEEGLSILRIEKQVQLIRKELKKIVVVVLENMQAYNRKRLIDKCISFVVPGKQMYLPDLLIDLQESFQRYDTQKSVLIPSAQVLLIYKILSGDFKWQIEEYPFKHIAEKFGYTPMTITKAIANLKNHDLIEVLGGKEKFIRFKYEKKALWKKVKNKNIFTNPVLKTIFIDEKPKGLNLPKSNVSALPYFTSLNPSNQEYYAIEKGQFYSLQEDNVFKNENLTEGKYALEVWKYKPLNMHTELGVVDPISLFLSLNYKKDERIQMALNEILKKHVW